MVVLLSISIMSGCAINSPREAPANLMGRTNIENSDQLPARQWYQACFRMPLNENGEPDFTIDYILADKVVAPTLQRHVARISLWRFHRRSARDVTGHQFSFLYYTDEDTHSEMAGELQNNPFLRKLMEKEQVIRFIPQCRGGKNRQQISSTSDPHWDPMLQKSWPYFIMGVSASWLSLIHQADIAIEGGENNIEAGDSDSRTTIINNEKSDLYARYEQIEAKVTEIWQEEGQHAYLHHLNALFGYEPLKIQKWLSF
ncbi:hypothetical protein [Hahella sp. CCB-MM4]|uniref:hypothetical protein n=1 Tax=Hahella sp. (strain CCB-MM4) TaxID=1926491 RepID=UPI000B9C0FF6|nr:hypothetical protein [Hahella sp. CCB-MM4]